ncbi:MAG TPA: 2-dehydropantoate 2-reductase [Solirubrobacteraceae bacterium]|nr:2-dehydropantoate 2-reductase [Solirubrobacteraceae bacterium]
MRIAVVGTGAIGATFAAALERAGHTGLVLCARTPRELTVERDGEPPQALTAPTVTNPEEAGGRADWVLLAVKAHQTAGAAPWLEELAGPGTVVVVLQNGVEQRELVTPLARGAAVLPSVVWVPAEVAAPGRVRQRGPVALTVPDGPEGRALQGLLRDGVTVSDDFATVAWHKLAVNAVAGLMVLARRRAGMFARADVAELARAYAEEVFAVARAAGADPSPGAVGELLAYYRDLPGDLGTSMLFDAEAGRALEWEARNGVVRRLGALHEIPTPISDVVVPLLAAASEPMG